MVGEIIKKGVGPVLLLLLISACGEIGGSGQCGGGEGTGSCLRIESITPQYLEKNRPSVDVVQVDCDASASTTKLEPMASHSAELVISNRPIPPLKKEDISDITLRSYSISYIVNRCPSGATCPALDLLLVNPGQTFLVPADGSVTFTGLNFFPLDSKNEYRGKFGSTLAFPHYTANYRFTGTDSRQNPVSVEGSSSFEIGNFDNCE